MTILAQESPTALDDYAGRRAVALSNVRLFRAMARRALRDGLPRPELRAANALAAARIVLAHAKREARRYRAVRAIVSPRG